MRGSRPQPRIWTLVLASVIAAGCLQPGTRVSNDASGMGLATLFEPDAWMPAEVRLNYRNSASSAPHRGVQEAMVAINPSDPKNVLVFGMDFNVRNDNPDVYAASRLFRSVDGGRTWTDEGILPFDADAPAPTRPSGDPVVIFDRDGMAHVAALSASEGQRGIHVRSSNDGGQTWSSPIIAVADVRNTATNDCRGTDKEMLGSDASTHRLYLTFTWFIYDCSLPSYEYGTLIGKTRAEVWMSTSDDRGRSWAAPVRLRDSYAIGSVPRVGPDGTLYVVMYSTEKAPVGSACPSLLGTLFGEPFSAVAVMASKDGGNSWRTHLQGVCESTWMNVVQKRLGLPPVPILVTAPGLSVDPQTGDAYVAFLSTHTWRAEPVCSPWSRWTVAGPGRLRGRSPSASPGKHSSPPSSPTVDEPGFSTCR